MDLNIQLFDVHCAPTRAYEFDAGLDCYARITDRLSISQFSTVKVPLGFAVEIPKYHVGDLRPRSGHSEKGITVEFGTIDSGYTGEVCAIITNNTSTPYHLTPYEKCAQLVVVPIAQIDNINFVVELPKSDRGRSGFGSSGK